MGVGGRFDDRIEHSVNWDVLDETSRFAWHFHGQSWTLEDLTQKVFTNIKVDRVPLPEGTFGMVMGSGGHWRIHLNERLAGPFLNMTYAHEVAHTRQPRLALGFCDPTQGMSVAEQEAHTIAAILAVPLAIIKDSDIYCEAAPLIAKALGVPTTYVHMRNAVAVFRGEKRGDANDASARWNGALVAHQNWMHKGARLLIESKKPPSMTSIHPVP